MNKSIRNTIALGVSLLVLTGCIPNIGPDEPEKVINPNEATVNTTTNRLSSDYYRAVIVDGRYQLGASASMDRNLSSYGNTKAFEEGLLTISKAVFPPDQYYLQEGQLINENTLTSWLGRESEDNPEGLNPALQPNEADTANLTTESESPTQEGENPEAEGETTEQANDQVVVDNQATPIYLSQILEKNIMVENADGFSLSGIVLGLAMNSSYTYTDQDGVVHEQEISMGEIRERGKQIANIIVGRLRNTEALRSVPIVVGIFRVAPNNEAVGGTYVLDGISREGNSVADWTEHNEYRLILPIVDQDIQSEQYTYFDNFRNAILDFFPNLNGIAGEALYVDDGLASLNVTIYSQFYQRTEITALSQHVTDVAQRELPKNVAIEIKIESIEGIEAYVGRAANDDKFQSHVFY